MTREQEIRAEVMIQAYGARPLWQSASLMARQARKAGLDYTAAEVDREAQFLLDQLMLHARTNPVTGERMFAITSAGIIHQEQQHGAA